MSNRKGYKKQEGEIEGVNTRLGAHKTSKACCCSQTISGGTGDDDEEGIKARAAPITFELAISTWLAIEDLARALSQGSRVLRRNGGGFA